MTVEPIGSTVLYLKGIVMIFEPHVRTFEEWIDENPEVRDEFPESDTCPRCDGIGTETCDLCDGYGNLDDETDEECSACQGEGTIECGECYGYDVEDEAMNMYDDQVYADTKRLERYNKWLSQQ